MIEGNNFEQDNRESVNENLNTQGSEPTQNKKSRRGFAAMDPNRQKEIARQGGQVAHKLGVAHQWSSEEAREAGRKGGQNSRGGGRNRSGAPQ